MDQSPYSTSDCLEQSGLCGLREARRALFHRPAAARRQTALVESDRPSPSRILAVHVALPVGSRGLTLGAPATPAEPASGRSLWTTRSLVNPRFGQKEETRWTIYASS